MPEKPNLRQKYPAITAYARAALPKMLDKTSADHVFNAFFSELSRPVPSVTETDDEISEVAAVTISAALGQILGPDVEKLLRAAHAEAAEAANVIEAATFFRRATNAVDAALVRLIDVAHQRYDRRRSASNN